MPTERGQGGGMAMTGNAVFGYRARACMNAIEFYLKTGMKVTATGTPTRLRDIANEFTGKTYSRSKKGLKIALEDMRKLTEGKTLDQIGEIYRVNQAVGGVAADLQEGK